MRLLRFEVALLVPDSITVEQMTEGLHSTLEGELYVSGNEDYVQIQVDAVRHCGETDQPLTACSK